MDRQRLDRGREVRCSPAGSTCSGGPETTYDALARARYASAAQLATETGCGVDSTVSALSFLCQGGRAMYDLGGGVYRHRELFREPFELPRRSRWCLRRRP
ncbi:MAG: hypothetical protein R3A48_06405 [Polyangiales bacterium]